MLMLVGICLPNPALSKPAKPVNTTERILALNSPSNDLTYIWVIGLGGGLLIPEMVLSAQSTTSQYWTQSALYGFTPQILMISGYTLLSIGFLMGFSKFLIPTQYPGRMVENPNHTPASFHVPYQIPLIYFETKFR